MLLLIYIIINIIILYYNKINKAIISIITNLSMPVPAPMSKTDESDPC